jgi:GAF domain-containing protein
VPIVAAHHEKWDGSGYPHGLKGEAIPIGARILGAVDCLDALASDRQYRRALPLQEAMARVMAESGTSFDPRVVDILSRRYIEWERLAKEEPHKSAPKLSTDVKIERGAAPAAGFAEADAPMTQVESNDTALDLRQAAAEEGRRMLQVSQQLASYIQVEDALAILSVALKRLVPYDAIAVYIIEGNALVPAYVSGVNWQLFSGLRIPLGEGLSGWVASNNKPIVNGNPSVEPGYLNDASKFSTLRSCLATPLEGDSGVIAVLALYRAQQDAFKADDLRIISIMAPDAAASIQNLLTKARSASALELPKPLGRSAKAGIS